LPDLSGCINLPSYVIAKAQPEAISVTPFHPSPALLLLLTAYFLLLTIPASDLMTIFFWYAGLLIIFPLIR